MTMGRSARSRPLLLVLGLAAGSGCDRPTADVDFGGEEQGPDRFHVLSEDGGVKLGLTDEVVYFSLSDSLQTEIRSEMEQSAEREGIGGMIGGIVSSTVGRALGFRAKYPIEEIRDIRWQDGELHVEFVEPGRRLDEFRVEDRPAAEAFREEDVRAFAEEFHRARRDLEAGGA